MREKDGIESLKPLSIIIIGFLANVFKRPGENDDKKAIKLDTDTLT